MPEGSGEPEKNDLEGLRTALRRLPGLRLERDGGAQDDQGWWHISMMIDPTAPTAWRTVAVMAKLFNTDSHPNGSAIFKPSARLADETFDEDLILWSLSHLYGEFPPELAARKLEEHLSGEAGPMTMED